MASGLRLSVTVSEWSPICLLHSVYSKYSMYVYLPLYSIWLLCLGAIYMCIHVAVNPLAHDRLDETMPQGRPGTEGIDTPDS